MDSIEGTIQVSWRHRVLFTDHLFDPKNLLLRNTLGQPLRNEVSKLLVVIDQTLAETQPKLAGLISSYCTEQGEQIRLVCPPVVQPGGEQAKNSWNGVAEIHKEIERHHID